MRLLVLGAGISGLAVARNALARGFQVVCYDANDVGLPEGLSGVVMVTGQWRDSYLDDTDLVVASPGFPPSSPPLRAAVAAGRTIMSEAQYGLDQLHGAVVGVTGTNGKSTVTDVTARMLVASGIDAIAAGNIGRSLTEIVALDPDVVVAELSSFQLHLMDVSPKAATILNIAPDHLDWHGSHEAYVAAKASIADHMGADDLFVANADDPVVTDIAAGVQARVVMVSGLGLPERGNGVDGDDLIVGGVRYRAPTDDASYRFDLVVAATLASHLGAHPDAMASVIADFTPGEHRRNTVAIVDGVRWINDSKGTNPHAAVAAASAYERVHLLAGGRNKAVDLAPIGSVPTVVQVYAFGEAGEEIAASATRPVSVHATMHDAMIAARAAATSGDVVLLSPGCTSFDEFTSYAERGTRFAEIVKDMEGGDGS